MWKLDSRPLLSPPAPDSAAPKRRTRRILAPALALALAATAVRAQSDEPLLDPIPEAPVPSDVVVMLEELVQMPPSSPEPPPTDPRLKRRARINFVGELPDGSGRLFVPDLNGKLYLLKNGTPIEYLDVRSHFVPEFWNHRGLGTGFGFVAFHPEFASNGLFYTVHTEARDALTTKVPDWTQVPVFDHGVLSEWTANDPAADTFTGTRRELMRIGFQTQIHSFQEINFNPFARPGDEDYGLLYIAAGDGGAGPAGTFPQNLAQPHGKILRIDPRGHDSLNGKYGIPPSNPFVGQPGKLGEIYAYGLRNPHRFSWDRHGNGGVPRFFIGMIGEHNIESIYDALPGDNFGWTEREGPFVVKDLDPTCSVYPLPANDASFGYVYPVVAYDHDPPPGFPRCVDDGDAVIGGYVYRGHEVPELKGKYVFGDDVNGKLWYAVAHEMQRGGPRAVIHQLNIVDTAGHPVTMQELVGDTRVDLRFGRDSHGELYVLAKANAKIWKVKRAPRPGRGLGR
jgi:glucose/arabinose dehydrogenase